MGIPSPDPDAYDPHLDVFLSVREAFRVIRERVAAGGPGWTPHAIHPLNPPGTPSMTTNDQPPSSPSRGYRLARRKAARVSTFGPSIMDALMAGTRLPGVSIAFPTLHMALAFRRRLYELRGAMDREKHPDFPLSMSVKVYLVAGRTKDDSATIHLRPADSEFTEIVRHAGIRSRAEVGPTVPPIDSADVMSKFDSLLKELK